MKCFACYGEGMVLTEVYTESGADVIGEVCDTCHGTGVLTKAKEAEMKAKQEAARKNLEACYPRRDYASL